MRIAQIGAGRIGQLHAAVMARQPGVDELIVADIVASRADALAERVEAGIPFLLGFQRRFDAAYVEARRLVASGEIGRLYQLRMTATDHTPPPESYIPTSGKLFRDASIHDFDAVRYVTGGEVATVYVEGAVLGFDMFARYGDIDTSVATMRLRDDTLVSLAGGRHNPRGYDIRMELTGSRDAVAIGLGPRTPIRPLDTGSFEIQAGWDSFLDRFAPAYEAELTAFVDIAAGRATSACTARDGLEAMRIAEAASRSFEEHRVVAVEEIA